MAFRILVLCTGNSARSQIAEALLVARGGHRIEALSAGSQPAPRVNPYAVQVLREHGIVWEGKSPRSIDSVTGRPMDLVITVCDNARDACPFFPGAATQVHWGLPDPADAVGSDAAVVAFQRAFDAISRRVDALLALPLETLSASALGQRAQAIHDECPT